MASLLHNALIKCYQNSIFLETRIQRLLDGLIFVEKGLGVHLQCMLKMSKIYTLAEILSKISVKKEGKLRTFNLQSWFDKLMIWCTACTTYTFTFGKC